MFHHKHFRLSEFLSNGSNLIKILCITGFFSIILNLIIILFIPSNSGYEISIYDAYPLYFWFNFVLAMFIGQIVFVTSTFYPSEKKLWNYGIFIIMLTNSILLLMPFARSYEIYGRGDVLSHIGSTRDILTTGFIGAGNYYPIEHILSSILFYFTNISLGHISILITPVFIFIYIMFLFLLFREIFDNKKELIFSFSLSSILLFGDWTLFYAPTIQSLFLLPLILYFFFKSRKQNKPFEFNFLLIILLFAIVFFHPLTTLFVILILVLLEVCQLLFKFINSNQDFTFEEHRKPFKLILICITSFIVWYFSYASILNSVQRVIEGLVLGSGETEYMLYSTITSRVGISLFDMLRIIIYTQGQVIILGILLILYSIYLVATYLTKKNIKMNFVSMYFYLCSVIFIALTFSTFFNDIIVSYARIVKYFLIFSPPTVGLWFYTLSHKTYLSPTSKKKLYSLFFLVLLLLIYFSTFNLFYSEKTNTVNHQVTRSEIDGMKWFFASRNDNYYIQEIGISQSRFHEMLFGTSKYSKSIRYNDETRPIDHFNYTISPSYGDSYMDARYLLISELGRISSRYLHPNYYAFWRFTQYDFYKLENDSTVYKIYSNHNLDIYGINGRS